MLRTLSPHVRAVLQALFVTFLWSTSFVLVKIGLQDIPALPDSATPWLSCVCFPRPFSPANWRGYATSRPDRGPG
jgi:drug/metabolite transporter (DMT)-like permease